MADQLHPFNSPTVPKQSQTTSPENATAIPKPLPPPPSGKPIPPPRSSKPAPPPPSTKPAPLPPSRKPAQSPETYIIKIPRDQVFRVPPPENARLFEEYIHRKKPRSCCRNCFCWIIKFIFILAVLSSIVALPLFFVFRPEKPKYSIESITIRGINIMSPSSTISPEFNITVKADNPNDKIGIRYLTDSSAVIFYEDVKLCNGALPAFYQPSNNVTVFKTVLKGNEILLGSEDRIELLKAKTKRRVPLTVMFKAPVKIKVGSVMTWKITVRVYCEVTVDKLTVQAKIVSKKCRYRVHLW